MATQTPTEIQPERLKALESLSLLGGSHDSSDEGMCAMEAVAFVAGEPHDDHPQCACPVLGNFMRAWNDGLPSDADRDRLLKPFVVRLIGTKSTPEVELRRGFMAFDWLVRVHAPAWMDLTPSLAEHAAKLRALPALDSNEAIDATLPTLHAAKESAAAAGDAARDAARAAAGTAARAAAGAAAGDAAAWGAAWAAARAAVGDALAPVVASLQASACDLLDRMIAEGGAR